MPIPRDRVLTYIRQEATRPLKPRELARALRVPDSEYRTFRRLLKQLEREGAIVRLRHNRLGPPERLNLATGRLSVNPDGFGFVAREGGGPDVFIGSAGLRTAMHGDRVVVRVTDRAGRRRQPEGEVVRVLERAVKSVVGTLRSDGRFTFVEPDDPRLIRDVYISSEEGGEAQPGQKVVARIEAWPTGRLNPEGRIVDVLGDGEDPRTDIPAILHEFGLPIEFPPHVCEAAAAVSADIADDEIRRREDLRDLPCITIDPEDARDHDDAVSLEVDGAGHYRLGVHIADVSHFVPEGSALDHEALTRGTSVYLPDRVLPMLPEALSADICSLRPGQDRLTLSALVRLDADGRVTESRLAETVIRSRVHLTYEQVQRILDSDGAAASPHADTLRHMDRLRQALTERRKRRGAIDLDLPEPRVILDTEGHTVEVRVPKRLDSHRLIEEFMLLANETVARRMTDRDVPTLYRVHDRPDAARLGAYARLATAFGRRFPRVDRITPHGIQSFLTGLEGEPAQRVLSAQLLRSMKKAVYSRTNLGHFGLACPCYTHFTSPIRRYPDLLVHRLLRESEFGRMSAKRRAQLEERLPAIAEMATQREVTAQEAEWGALEVKQIRYLEGRVGEHFQATVVSIVTAGIFCELDEVLIDGFVRVSSLTDDYYRHDENRGALVGERTGRTFRLGDRVTVALTAASRHRRRIDLRIVEGGETVRPKSASKRRPAKPARPDRRSHKRRTRTRP